MENASAVFGWDDTHNSDLTSPANAGASVGAGLQDIYIPRHRPFPIEPSVGNEVRVKDHHGHDRNGTARRASSAAAVEPT